VDRDVVPLADPIEPADALLEKLGVERQVVEHEVVDELEVPALAADLRAQEDARAVLLREVGGVAISLHERESLVEDGALDGDLACERVRDRADLLRRLHEEE